MKVLQMGIMRLLKERANGNCCSDGIECVSVPLQRQGTPNNKHDEATALKMKVGKHACQETEGLGYCW